MRLDPMTRRTRQPEPLHRQLGLTDDELAAVVELLGPRAHRARARDVRGDVVGALLLQVVEASPRPLPHRGAVGARRPGRGRGRHRRRRRARGRDPHREPQPPVRGRALPGRGHRRRRDHPRHLLDGRAPDRADGPAALRPARRRRAPATCSRASSPASAATATRSACRPSAARSCSTTATATTRSSTCCASACCPVERLVLAKAEGVGNLAVLLGSATGRDGIGGASVLASAGFDEGDEAKRPSVQVGDPFEEKRLIEACLELLDAGLAVGVQDLGAAGLSCAASETAAKTGAGMDVDLARMPKREPGMNAGRGDDVGEPGAHARDRHAREPRRGARRCAARWEIRAIGRRARHRHRPLPRVRRPVRRGRRARARTRRSPRGDDAAGGVVRPRRRSPTSRSAASATARSTTARSPRPPTAPRVHADDPAPALAQRFPAGTDLSARAARAARVADHRRQVVGVPPVRPPAVPQHRGRPGRRRRGAAAQGHAARARAHHRRQGAVLRARPVHRRAPRRARSGPQRRVRRRGARRRSSTASTSATPSTPR